jgi:hypothetical protein
LEIFDEEKKGSAKKESRKKTAGEDGNEDGPTGDSEEAATKKVHLH